MFYQDVVVDGPSHAVKLIQVSGDPPATRDDYPIPPIPFDDLPSFEELHGADLNFECWPLIRGTTVGLNFKTVDENAVAVGFSNSFGDGGTAFDAFQVNNLTVEGIARDFAVTVDGNFLRSRLMRAFVQAPFNVVMPIPLLGLEGHPRLFSLRFHDESPGPLADWGQPFRFILDVDFEIAGDRIDVLAPITAQFEVTATGGLDLRLSIPLEDIEPSLDDQFWPFASFSDLERWTTAAWLTFVLGVGVAREFESQVADDTFTRSGEGVVRILDPRFFLRPGRLPIPRLICQGIRVTTDALVLFGSVQRTVPEPPHLVISRTTVQLAEEVESACSAAPEAHFVEETVLLRNAGAGPLFICPDETRESLWPGFPFYFHFNDEDDITDRSVLRVEPGQTTRLTVGYRGARRPGASAELVVVTNDPLRLISRIALLVGSGTIAFEVVPPALSITRANNAMGSPVMRLANCQPVPVRVPAGEFRIINTGANPLYLCRLDLDDPDDVFRIPFSPRQVEPGGTDDFAVLFFPKEAGRIYRATCTISFAGGRSYVLPIDATVALLPQPGEPGEWIDLNAGRACVPLEQLCRALSYFEPVGPGVLPLVDMTVEGLPPEAGLVMRDDQGRAHVEDRSGLPARHHVLAYTPNPDGDSMPGDPCRGEISGFGPGTIGPIGVDIEGWLIKPEGEIFPVGDLERVVVAGGWIHAARPDGFTYFDGRSEAGSRQPQRMDALPDALAFGRGLVAMAEGNRLTLREGVPGRFTGIGAKATLDQAPTALALHRGKLIVADAEGLLIHSTSGDRLELLGRVNLPGGIRAMQQVSKGVVALGKDHLFYVAIDEHGNARLAASISLASEGTKLSTLSGTVLVSGAKAAWAFKVIEGKLTRIAEYPLGHWSTGYLPTGTADLLFKRVGGNALQRCRIARHMFDRRRFEKAYELKFRPMRPETRGRHPGAGSNLVSKPPPSTGQP